jgi:hypothetical protein
MEKEIQEEEIVQPLTTAEGDITKKQEDETSSFFDGRIRSHLQENVNPHSPILVQHKIEIMKTGEVDFNKKGGYLKMRRIRQAAQPTPVSGELLIWSDSDDDTVWLVYNDEDAGGVKVQLT